MNIQPANVIALNKAVAERQERELCELLARLKASRTRFNAKRLAAKMRAYNFNSFHTFRNELADYIANSQFKPWI